MSQIQKEAVRSANKTHGHTLYRKRSKTFIAWANIIQRCDNHKNPNFHHYGGRGIGYDPRWKNFQAFLSDVGEAPVGHSIDRIDNSGSYSKENCRWITQREQLLNTRRSVLYTFRGESLSVADWADRLSINGRTIKSRLRKGWSIERALTEAVK